MRIHSISLLTFAFAIGCGAGNQTQPDGSNTPDIVGTDAVIVEAGDITAIPINDAGGIACLTDQECDDGNACQTHRCVINGEIGQCEYTSVADGTSCGAGTACGATCMAGNCYAQRCTDMDAGTMDSGSGPMDGGIVPTDGGIRRDASRDGSRTDSGGVVDSGTPPHFEIDPSCPGTCPYGMLTPVFPPFVELVPSSLPATCSNGFELGNPGGRCASVYTINSSRAGGARAVTLEIDFATYLIPDGVTITGVDGTGRRYTLFQSCHLKTWTNSFSDNVRPPDVAIRQYRVDVLPGTTRLDFDFGPVTSPTYIKVLGLCDFNVTRFTGSAWFATVP